MRFVAMETVIFNTFVINVVCTVIMGLLWQRNRKSLDGLSLWLAYYVLQMAAASLVLMKPGVPDVLSGMLGGTFMVAGTLAMYMGLQRLVGKADSRIHDYILAAALILVLLYFTHIQPSPTAQGIDVSLGILLFTSKCTWLLLRRVDTDLRPLTRGPGLVFGVYALVSAGRVIILLAGPFTDDPFFESAMATALPTFTYQILLIVLTLSLARLLNRLHTGDVRTREAYFRTMAGFTDDWEYWTGRKGEVIYVTPSCERITGYGAEEFMEHPELAHKIVHPDDAHRLHDHLDELSRSELEGVSDFRIVTRNGEIRWINHVCRPAHTAEGHWLGRRVVNRDITERKQTEIELGRQKALSEAMIRSAPNIVVGLGEGSRILFFNDFAEKLTGHKREAVLGKSWIELFIPADVREELHGVWEEIVDGKSVAHHYENRIITRSGEEKIISWNSMVITENGSFKMVLSTGEDITDRRLTEDLLHIRLRLFEFAAAHSLEELLQKTLDEVSELTRSPIGFYHFVETDQKTLSLQAWSTRTLKEFCRAEGKGMHYAIDQAGVWVDCVYQKRPVIHNDYPSLPHRKGMPDGHAPVIRELVVPITRADRIVAILGIGNKPADYTDKDIEIVSYLADIAWEIAEQKKAEEERGRLVHELRESLAKVKTLSGLLPICASCKKIRDDGGYWRQIETYIRHHSDAEFSHSICPECARKLYPDIDIYGEDDKLQS